MLKPKEFLQELARFDIKTEYEYGRIKLREGREDAREHYSAMLELSTKFEAALIYELAQTNANIMDAIEERAAIREADGLPGDIQSAIMCNLTN